jgi:putative spermidine/putrescine transport system permease protein
LTNPNNLVSEVVATQSGDDFRQIKRRSKIRLFLFNYIGLFPFLIFSSLFIAVPTLLVAYRAFVWNDGSYTLENFRIIWRDAYLLSLTGSLRLGLTSAVTGSVFGALICYGVVISRNKRLQKIVSTASGVFANTGGVPLAFFFIAAIGNYGLVTLFLQKVGIDIYAGSFTIFGFSGLVLVYLYFQIPLMIIVIYPAIDGIKNEWREAAANLGASRFMFWKYVAIPLLTPSFLGAFLLLFSNAFAAYATAKVLTSGTIPLLPLQIGSLVAGNVFADEQNIGMAMGLEMIVVVAIAMSGYAYLDRKTSKWRKK